MNQASPTWRAVLFDFDGTLADSFPAITASVNHVRSLYNLSPLSVEETRRGVGHGAVHLLQECVGQGSLEANLAAYREHHPSVLRSGTHLLPGVRSTLQLLYERRVKMGVCSNKPLVFTSQLLEILDIARFFSATLGPESVPHLKPAPDMLLAGIQQLSTQPADALYIGDMVVDIETARAAQVCVWAVATGSDDRDKLAAARPDRLLEDMAEANQLLRSTL